MNTRTRALSTSRGHLGVLVVQVHGRLWRRQRAVGHDGDGSLVDSLVLR